MVGHHRFAPSGGDPLLSVAVVVGTQRERAERVLDRLAAQTISADIEVLLVDTRPTARALALPSVPPVTILRGGSMSYGEARAAGVRAARAEIVAFLEDHSYPHSEWAEALVTAYGQPWAAVGYAITNANPRSRSSRIIHLATYGEWQSPLRGETSALPGGNVSYRRETLLDFGDDLPAMLQADFNIHARMRRRGLVLAVEPTARAQHESGESLVDAMRASFVYSRVLAADRARLGGWTMTRRLSWAAGNLWGAPLVRLAGLVHGLRRQPGELARVAAYLPAIAAILLSSAVGEMLGFLLGEGRCPERLMYWEVDAPRARRS